MRRVITIVSVCAFTLAPGLAAAQPASPTPKPGGAPGITAVTAILVNVSDGDEILFTRHATQSRAPASLTKVMTALVARDEYSMDEIVTADPIVLNTHGSDMGLEPGMKVSVNDLVAALLVKSANDAGMALAAHHPAGYEYFIQLMNEKARSLGAYDSQFRNPHGLDQDGHYSSARDMAIFARELFADPLLASISDQREHSMTWKGRPRVFGTHHRLVRHNPIVIGGKTGFTDNAGHCLITGAETSAGTLVAVVMGSQNHYGDTLSLFEHGKTIAVSSSSGGGDAADYGRLPVPPEAPDIALGEGLLRDESDPRDDLRWPLLMITLALITAATILRSRQQRRPAAVDIWLTSLHEQARRGR